jgi:alkaline phosphatase D
MNISELKILLPYAFKAGLTPNIIGSHGIGKSSVVYQVAQDLGYEVIELRLGQMSDAGELIGLPEFNRDAKGKALSTTFVKPDWFPTKENTILFLDEINRSNKDILQAIFQLVYDGRIANHILPKNVFVVAASNPPTDDYAVLDFADSAFQDRFIHIKMTPSFGEWMTYGKNVGMSSKVLGFINGQPDLLEQRDLADFNLDFVKPSRRSWERVSKLEQTGLSGELFRMAIAGLVGANAATAYIEYLASQVKPPSAEEIINDFNAAKKKIEKITKGGDSTRGDMFDAMWTDLAALIRSSNDKIVQIPTTDGSLKYENTWTKEQALNFVEFVKASPVEVFIAHFNDLVLKNVDVAKFFIV